MFIVLLEEPQERRAKGIGASKGLAGGDPFPPGHILHYPPG